MEAAHRLGDVFCSLAILTVFNDQTDSPVHVWEIIIFRHVHVSAICVPVGACYVVVEKLNDFGSQVAAVWDVDAASSWNESMLRLPMH